MVIGFLWVCLLANSCIKENAKKVYIFRLEFSSGDVWEGERYIFEKYKKNTGTDNLKNEKNVIYLKEQAKGSASITLYKVNHQKLTGIGYLEEEVSNFNMLNNQDGIISGPIELDGVYDQFFRKYAVKGGTFKFKLNGNFTEYTGKWSLKRK